MLVGLGVLLLVLDDLEEDENEPDDAEQVAADALRKVLVEKSTDTKTSNVGELTKMVTPYKRNVVLHRGSTSSVHVIVFRMIFWVRNRYSMIGSSSGPFASLVQL
jgi:hypothetical protein